MPFFANTPESLINRTDSKNPSNTCKGITSSGRPCRRSISASVVAQVKSKFGNGWRHHVDDPHDERLYCWQHKEQASLSAQSSVGPKTHKNAILEERTSLDTLADRLGLVALAQEEKRSKQRTSGRQNGSHGRKHQQRHNKMARPKPEKTVEFCCCFRVPIEEVSPPPRPMPRPLQTPSSAPVTPTNGGGRKVSSQQHLSPSPSPYRQRPSPSGTQSLGPSSRRSSAPSTSSQTAAYLALIPPNASPQTASLLMTELAKPISQVDEPGYMYIFWLTSESQPTTPPAEAARSLLTPPTKRPSGQRRPSDVLQSFASSPRAPGSRSGSDSGPKKILLKIGRATNVQRRLNEWTRQCGYNLSLVRYYPYIPSSSPSGGSSLGAATTVPRKVPHSHRVERLVHIELAGRGLRVADREKCSACGREHREWFEVEATRKAVADVDEVVRRWVAWDERMGGVG